MAMIREDWHLVSYVAMNAIAIRKILKKYDKVSSGEIASFQLQMFVFSFVQKDLVCSINHHTSHSRPDNLSFTINPAGACSPSGQVVPWRSKKAMEKR